MTELFMLTWESMLIYMLGRFKLQSKPNNMRNFMLFAIISIVVVSEFTKASGEIIAVAEAKPEGLLVKLIKSLLGSAREVCYFGDDRRETLQEFLRAFATKNLNSFELLAQSSCDSYLLHIRTGNFQRSLKHLNPHTKVILLISNEDYSNLAFDSKLLYERGLFALAVKNSRNNQAVEVINLQTNKSETFHPGEENLTFSVPAWNPKDFLNQTGRRIIVSTFHCPPFVEIVGNRLEGIEHKIIHELIKDWPIEYKVIRDKDQTTVINKFLLAVRSVQRRKADMAFCFLWQRVLMERNVDFSTAMFPTCVTFLVHKPKLLKGYTFFFQAFRDIDTFIMFLLTATFLEIMYKMLITDLNALLSQHRGLYHTTTTTHVKFKMTSSRICLVVIVSFYFLFFSYYSAKLTVLSSFPRFSQKYINSFTDMVEQKTRWVEPESDIQQWLNNTNDSICVGIAHNFRIEDNRVEINKKLKGGQYGYLVKRFSEDFISGSEELDNYAKTYLRPIPGCLATFYSSIAFQKNSPFPLYLNRKINGMFENGIVNYWQELTLRKRTYGYLKSFKSLYVDQMITAKFDMDKFSGLLYILFFGYGLSIISFICEWFKGRVSQNVGMDLQGTIKLPILIS